MIGVLFWTLYTAVAFRVTKQAAHAVAHDISRSPDAGDRIVALMAGVIAGLLWPLVAVGYVLYRVVYAEGKP